MADPSASTTAEKHCLARTRLRSALADKFYAAQLAGSSTGTLTSSALLHGGQSPPLQPPPRRHENAVADAAIGSSSSAADDLEQHEEHLETLFCALCDLLSASGPYAHRHRTHSRVMYV